MRYILFCLLVLSNFIFAQTGVVRGTIYDNETGEPLIFTNVFLVGTTIGAVTDNNGFFSLPEVPVGEYTLTIKALGYDSVGATIEVLANKIVTKNLYTKPNSIELQTVDINTSRIEKEKEVRVSSVKITPQQMKHMPTIGGEPDLAQYLQIMPGVVFTGDQGGQLYIRGGAPIQNKVLLDGMVVYNPFHSIGLFSIFETDIIRSVDVYTGGFNAEYGDRVSAVIDVTTRDGNKKNLAGKVSVSPFVSKAILEGPLSKKNDKGNGASFILATKNSYLDQTSKLFYTYADSNGLPYRFNDFYGKMSFNSSNGSKLNLFGFNFNDRVNFVGASELNWRANGFGTNFVIVPGKSQVLIDGRFAYSDYRIQLTEADGKPRDSKIGGFNLGMDFTYFLKKGELKYGLEIVGFKTTFEFYNSFGLLIDQLQNTTELAGFLKYKITVGKLLLEPSFRVQYYASLLSVSPEPRLGMKYNATDRLRFKFAGGRYSQNLISATADRDIVALFNGYLSGPDITLKDVDGNIVKANIQKAWHAIGGVEYDLSNHWEINVEPYIKYFSQLININRYKLFASDPDYLIETGKAYGIDFLLKYEFKRLFVWATYSLIYNDRYDGQQHYPPHFDRRHNSNFVGAYTFGSKLDWEVSARWNLGSGFPFTQTQGFYEYFNFSQGITTNYATGNGDLGILYADKINGGRLPYYHRLDVAIKKQFAFKGQARMEANATVSNLYNRANIFYVDRVTNKEVYQLPILPSVGLNFSF